MKNLLCFSVLSTVLGLSGAAHAQVGIVQLTSPLEMSPSATTITFEGHPHGTAANSLYLPLGAEFRNFGAAPVPIYDWGALSLQTTSPDNVINTVSGLNGSVFSDFLDVLFTSPTVEVGAFFGNDPGSAVWNQARLSVFDVQDQLLGSVTVATNNNYSVDQFIGLWSDTPFVRARFENFSGNYRSMVLDDVTFTTAATAAVPEPSTLVLLTAGALALAASARLRRRRIVGTRSAHVCVTQEARGQVVKTLVGMLAALVVMAGQLQAALITFSDAAGSIATVDGQYFDSGGFRFTLDNPRSTNGWLWVYYGANPRLFNANNARFEMSAVDGSLFDLLSFDFQRRDDDSSNTRSAARIDVIGFLGGGGTVTFSTTGLLDAFTAATLPPAFTGLTKVLFDPIQNSNGGLYDYEFNVDSINTNVVASVPEPATYVGLIAMGLTGGLIWRRRN